VAYPFRHSALPRIFASLLSLGACQIIISCAHRGLFVAPALPHGPVGSFHISREARCIHERRGLHWFVYRKDLAVWRLSFGQPPPPVVLKRQIESTWNCHKVKERQSAQPLRDPPHFQPCKHFSTILLDIEIRFGMGRARQPKFNPNQESKNMTTRNGNAPRGCALRTVAERRWHRGRSLNAPRGMHCAQAHIPNTRMNNARAHVQARSAYCMEAGASTGNCIAAGAATPSLNLGCPYPLGIPSKETASGLIQFDSL
jgi:hypothetical protein